MRDKFPPSPHAFARDRQIMENPKYDSPESVQSSSKPVFENTSDSSYKPSLDIQDISFNETPGQTAFDFHNKSKEEPALKDESSSPENDLPRVKLSSGTEIFLPDNPLIFETLKDLNKGIDPVKNFRPLTGKRKPTSDSQKPEVPEDKSSTEVQNEVREKRSEASHPSNIRFDENNQIEQIDYPGGMSRRFKHDEGSGLSEYTLTDKGKSTTFEKSSDGNWYVRCGDLKLKVDGQFELSQNGDFATRQGGASNPWHVERPDGSKYVEEPRVRVETLPSGKTMEIQQDRNGNLTQITLPNGSKRNYEYAPDGKDLVKITDAVKTTGGIVNESYVREFDPVKNKLKDSFVKTIPDGTRTRRSDVKVKDDGSYEYKNEAGETKISRLAQSADASPETKWTANIEKDSQGRFKTIDNDKFIRQYEYFEGSDKIKSYTVKDKTSGESATWSRTSPESQNWTARHPQHGYRISGMQGDYRVTKDGVHIVDRAGQPTYGFLGDGTRVDIKQTGNSLTASENGKVKYVRKQDGSIISANGDNEISAYNQDMKQRVTWRRDSDGNWQCDDPYEPSKVKDLSFNEKGEFSFTDQEGNRKTRTMDGFELVDKEDGSQLVFDRQGTLSKIKFGDTTRVFERENGKITGMTETDKNGETRTRFPYPTEAGQTIEAVSLTNDGTFSYKVKTRDGKIEKNITELSNGLHVEKSAEGRVQRVVKPNGFTREFNYKDNELIQVKDTRETSKGEKSTVWTRGANPDGSLRDKFNSTTDSGNKRTPRTIEKVNDDGSYDYRTEEMKPGQDARVQRMSGGDGFFSDNVEDAHLELLEELEEHMDEPRLKRMQEMMKAYETRMQSRAEARKIAGVKGSEEIDRDVSQTITRTYGHLVQMLNPQNADTFYNESERVFLAENFMYHAQDPSTMDQGAASRSDWEGHGTCWIQSAHIWGMTQRTDKMADLLKQVALEGKYTTKQGGHQGDGPKTIQFSRDYLSFPKNRQETGWCISKATDMWDKQPGLIRQCDGDRSPVGKIFDYVLPVVGNRPQNARRIDGGTYESFMQPGNRWYTGNAEIMEMVTGGDKPCAIDYGRHTEGFLIDNDFRKSLLEKGTVLNYKPGHLMSMHLRQDKGQWMVIQDDQHGEGDDRIVERISDLAAWVRGDRNASTRVNERVNQRKFKLSTDYTIAGIITPSEDTNSFNTNQNHSRYPRRYRRYS